MINNNFVQIKMSKKIIFTAMKKALQNSFIDNLRVRNKYVQFDSKVRGYLGEIAITEFLSSKGITINDRDIYYKDENEDIDISISNNYHNDIILEVKTSLIPDIWQTLHKTIQNADIKIIKREKDYRDIKADFYTQIYFNFHTRKRDSYLSTIKGNIEDYSLEELYVLMNYDKLQEVFVAWIDKKTLCEYLDSQIVKTWSFSFRTFWKCPLNIAKSPHLLIEELKKYKRKIK